MRSGPPRLFKPSIGTPLDRGHSLLDGLLWYAPFWEGAGTKVTDLIGGNNLVLANASGVGWSPGYSPQAGVGVLVTTANNSVSGAWPAKFQSSSGPYSIVCAFSWTGTAHGSFANIFGLQSSNANNGSSQPCILQWDATNNYVGAYFDGTATYLSSYTILANTVYVAVITVNGLTSGGGSSSVRLYKGGALVASTTGAGLTNAITWGSASGVGVNGFGSVASQANVYWGGVYNRILSTAEAQAWAINPWQIFRSPVPLAAIMPGESFTASPTTIFNNVPSGTSISLSGVATSWNSGTTTFTISGVTGATKASQSVSSTTAATITVDTSRHRHAHDFRRAQ